MNFAGSSFSGTATDMFEGLRPKDMVLQEVNMRSCSLQNVNNALSPKILVKKNTRMLKKLQIAKISFDLEVVWLLFSAMRENESITSLDLPCCDDANEGSLFV